MSCNIDTYLAGNGTHEGRPVIVTNSDSKTIARQVYEHLAKDKSLGVLAYRGLSQKRSGVWQSLTIEEWTSRIREAFAFMRLQSGVGTVPGRLVLADLPPHLVPLLKTGRAFSENSHRFPRVSNDVRESGVLVCIP
jgi:hypothetical protein